MNNHSRRLARHYAATLRQYLADNQEADLEEAYELGRRAIARGLGVLDMARIHQQAIAAPLRRAFTAKNQTQITDAAGTFLLESLSPFEVTHRGFRETNAKLQQVITTLESRNRELAQINRNLEVEIAERRRAEQALHDSELKFRSVVESARDGLVIADQTGRIIFMNRAAEAMFGYSQAEVQGKSWTRFSPEANRAKYRKCMKQAVSARRFAAAGLTVEGCGRRKDGAVFPLELSFSAWKTVAGKFYTGIVRDITERKRVQEALRQSEGRYARLIETASDVIFYLSPDGRFAALNRAFEAITGWPRAAWLGKPFAPLLHADDVSIAVERFNAILRGLPTDQPGPWEYRVRKASGEFATGEVTLVREIGGGQTAGIFGIARDITERKHAEEALRQSEGHFRELFQDACRMQEDLRHLSNKVLRVQEEERKRISRELHDEVGQSLTAISVSLATVRNNGTAMPKDIVHKIADAQRVLRGTMDTVHRFARELRPAMLDELGLLPALRSCLKAFAERTGHRVCLHADPIAENLGDDEKTVLFRVAQESLTNVARHARASRVDCSIRKWQDGVCMEITDNGRSFREDAQHSGNARKRLGLLGMQERVRLVNGRFTIKPRFGKGTTVKVMIPFNSGDPLTLSKRGHSQNNNDRNHSEERTRNRATIKTEPRGIDYGKNSSPTG